MLLPPFKRKHRKNMKKFYIAPEMEEVLFEMEQPLLTASESEDIIDGPVPTVDDPSDDDLDW